MTPSTTITLHGYAVSNWFNCARAAMIEKGLGADYAPTRASREDLFLQRSPMGKIPWLETPDGPLAETVAILDYLDSQYPEHALIPIEPLARARVMQVVNIVQLYIEAPMRVLYPATFMGAEPLAAQTDATMDSVDRAMAAVDRLCSFAPFALGGNLSRADLVLFYTLELADRVSHHLVGRSMFQGRPKMESWAVQIRERASTRIVLGDFAPAFAEYCASRSAAWDEAAYAARDQEPTYA